MFNQHHIATRGEKRMRSLAVAVALTALTCIGLGTPAQAVPFLQGDIFASISNGLVAHYRADGTFLENLDTTGGGFTTGGAFDSNGNYYVTNFSNSRVAVFNTNGGTITTNYVSGLSTPESIVFDLSGNMYVGNLGNGIRKYDSTGNFLGSVTTARVDWFDLSADQSTFVYGQEGANLLTVSNALPGTPGPNFNAVPNSLSEAFAMRFLPDGGVLVADGVNIKRFDAAGNLIDSWDLIGVNGWFALNLDPDGTSFWSGSFNDGILRKFSLADSSLAPLQIIDTGCGTQCLFGVAVLGEPTVGGPPPPTSGIPTPAALWIFALGLGGLALARRRRAA